jgi:hypothetical protein
MDLRENAARQILGKGRQKSMTRKKYVEFVYFWDI